MAHVRVLCWDGLCLYPVLRVRVNVMSSALELSCSKENSLTIIRWYIKEVLSCKLPVFCIPMYHYSSYQFSNI